MARVRTPEDINREMQFINDSAEIKSTSVVTLSVPSWWVRFDDIPETDQLPMGLLHLILAYADYLPEEKIRYQYPVPINRAHFFTHYLSQIQYRLEQAANDLLSKGKIDLALALIRSNGKEILNVPTCGRDRFGTVIEGRTLLQMAAMAGDCNLREKKAEEKEDHGAVELLSETAGLTKAEVADQLFPVLFSPKAKAANNTRKNQILALFKQFGESLIRRKAELPKNWLNTESKEYRAIREKFKPEIDILRKDLFGIVFNQTIKEGYILDTSLIVELIQWFEDPKNLEEKRFESWKSAVSDLFWLCSYGLLQYVAMARDAHIHLYGVGYVADDEKLPSRTLEYWDGSSSFTIGYSLELMYEPLPLDKMEPMKLYITTKGEELVCYVREGKKKNEISLASLDSKIVESIKITAANFIELNAKQAKAIFDITSKKGYCVVSDYNLGVDFCLTYSGKYCIGPEGGWLYVRDRSCSSCCQAWEKICRAKTGALQRYATSTISEVTHSLPDNVAGGSRP